MKRTSPIFLALVFAVTFPGLRANLLGATPDEGVGPRFTLDGEIAQTTHCVSSSPIRLTVLPTSNVSLSVRIENSSGAPFQGVLRIVPFENPSSGSRSVKSTGDAVSVDLAAGERERIVALPLAELPPAHHGVQLSMDADGKEGVVKVRTVQASVSTDEGDSAHPIVYGLNAEGDARVASHQEWEVEGPRDQPQFVDGIPFKITYEFAPGWKYLELTRSEIPWSRISDTPDALGMWIYGDAGGCQPRARFKDQTGQVFQPSGPKIDWRGWRYVTFPMQTTDGSQLAHWGGANDGSIHYPISWESPFLLDNVSRAAAKGEIFISAPTLIY